MIYYLVLEVIHFSPLNYLFSAFRNYNHFYYLLINMIYFLPSFYHLVMDSFNQRIPKFSVELVALTLIDILNYLFFVFRNYNHFYYLMINFIYFLPSFYHLVIDSINQVALTLIYIYLINKPLRPSVHIKKGTPNYKFY